jgi:hypothetical protein
MYERCYLHCGHAKTGSTTLQSTFAANRELLSDLTGITYPQVPGTRGGNHMDLIGLPYVRKDTPMMTAGSGDRDALNAFFAQNPGQGGTLVLSSETVASLRQPELEALRDDLLRHCKEVVLVIYLRHPLSYAPSFAQTQIKNGVRSLADCCTEPRFVRYAHTMRVFEQVFGHDNIVARDFARPALVEKDIIADFLDVVAGRPDIARHPEFERRNRNVSLSCTAIALADYVYRTWPDMPRNQWALTQFLGTVEGPRVVLPQDARDYVEQAMEPHLDHIAQEYGITLDMGSNLSYGDVDYAGLLTPELCARVEEVTHPMRVAPSAAV